MPTITPLADVKPIVRPNIRQPRPVEAFEVPLKGDPDEQREIRGQRAIFLYVAVGALVWLLGWRLYMAVVGAP